MVATLQRPWIPRSNANRKNACRNVPGFNEITGFNIFPNSVVSWPWTLSLHLPFCCIPLLHIPFPHSTNNTNTMYRVAASHGACRRIGHVALTARPTRLLATLPTRAHTTSMVRAYERPFSCLPTQPTQLLQTKKAPTNIGPRRRFTTEIQETSVVEEEVTCEQLSPFAHKKLCRHNYSGQLTLIGHVTSIRLFFLWVVVATSIRDALL